MSTGADDVTMLAAPVPAVVPDSIDLDALLTDLRDDNVSAPAEHVDGLREVVATAADDGNDVYFVVLPDALPTFTYYRDVATALQADTGGTVIVLGPNSMGSSSEDFTRVEQESATESVPLSRPSDAAAMLYDRMSTPDVNWTLVTLGLIAVVIVGAVLARIRGLRAAARTVDEGGDDPAPGSDQERAGADSDGGVVTSDS